MSGTSPTTNDTRPIPAVPRPCVLGVRPEHVHLSPAGPLAAKVLVEEFLGSHRFAHLDTPAGRLIARTPAAAPRAAGDAVAVSFAPAAMNFFDPDSGGRL